LRDGMTVDVDIVTADVPRALSVPNDAIRRDDHHRPYVYVVRDGKAYRTPVTLGAAGDTSTIVRRGLRDGDVVVSDPSDAMKDGASVRPEASPSPSASG
jgi:multidrug efflux pump subunit AcrA (membrane-fusion protein)